MPFEIPGGATHDLVCSLHVLRAGEFASQLHLYLDDLGLREIILLVDGEAQEADSGEASDAEAR